VQHGTSAVNCRPLNRLFPLRITVSPQPLKRARFYPITASAQTLQQNHPKAKDTYQQ